MKIQIYAIASRSTDWFEKNFSMYQKRLPTHINLRLTTIPLAYRNKNSPIKAAVKKEGELLLKRISSKDTLIVMDENGKTLSTKNFSDWMHQWMLNSINPILAIFNPVILAAISLKFSDVISPASFRLYNSQIIIEIETAVRAGK